MQVYIIGIGQCGTSVAFDVISNLTGFVKSKEIESVPQEAGGAQVASNGLLKRLNEDFARTDRWRAYLGPWLSRLLDSPRGRKAFILPKIAIIDGNPNNFVKDAFGKFSGRIGAVEERERNGRDLKQLVALIRGTRVLGLGEWADGCANGLVGEVVTAAHLRQAGLRNSLGVDGQGNLTDDDDALFPVAVFLVVSSGGGATGSGGGVYLAQTDALLTRTGKGTQADSFSHTIVANAVVLPSLKASSDNRKYALNTGRALARHGNMITATMGGEGSRVDQPSSVILFSNPSDEGDSRALQRLNNYLSEFSIRLANFTYPGSVSRIARDVDTRELMFLRGKTCVLAMSHLGEDLWRDGAIESTLVQRAFANLYESSVDRPHGLSVESMGGGHKPASVLATASSAMVVVGVPPKFKGSLSIDKIGDCLREHSASELRSGIGTFAYGSVKHLELTVFLRYRSMEACPLAMHFVRQYVGETWDVDADEVRETEHIRIRAERDERDDEYAETFEAITTDLDALGHSMNLDTHVVHRPAEPRGSASLPAADLGRLQEQEGDA